MKKLTQYRLLLQISSFLLFLYVLVSGEINAQNNDNQLAFQYFQEKEYEKAAEYFDKLFNQTASKIYFDYYYRCLIELNQLDEAEKEIKKQYKKNKGEYTYLVDLGFVSKQRHDEAKAKEYYDEAVKLSLGNVQMVNKVGSSFITKSEFEYAELLYIEAREIHKNQNFRYELANVYISQRNYPKMVNEYLELIQEKPDEIKSVQDRLLYFVTNDRDSSFVPVLEQALIRKSQLYSANTLYPEMLIWLYSLQKEFAKALIQARSIDKRKGAEGSQVLALSRLAAENGDYEIALNGLQYIITSQGALYTDALLDLLSINYKQIEEGLITDAPSIAKVEQNYQKVIEELGLSSVTLRIIKNWAHMKAFYLNKPDEAIGILDAALNIKGIPFDIQAILRLEKADILLFQGNIWESALLFGLVEQENEQNPMGHEARFRKARLAYYSGNFNWSQAQLSVLKASTSKLIANDACELSALILDNLVDEDTFSVALSMFARADMFIMQHQNSLATNTLDSIIQQFASSSILDDVYFKKGQIAEKEGNYKQAVEFYKLILEKYAWDILADNAAFRIAELSRIQLNNNELAFEMYKKIITDYPDSIFATEARKQFRKLRGDIN